MKLASITEGRHINFAKTYLKRVGEETLAFLPLLYCSGSLLRPYGILTSSVKMRVFPLGLMPTALRVQASLIFSVSV